MSSKAHVRSHRSALSVSSINMWPLYVTILILGLNSRVYANSCPQEEDLFPCQCRVVELDNLIGDGERLTVTCESNQTIDDFEILRQSIRSLSGIKDVYLKLTGYEISMPSKLFSGIDIKQLIFESCHLYSLTNDNQPWFLGLENQIEELIIDSSLTAQEKPNIGQLDKLKTLILRRNEIPELEDDVFSSGFSNLESLYIFKNDIKKIGNNVFSQLNNLKSLELEDNHFGPIKRSMLPSKADKLIALRLDNNSLTDLPEDIFTGMPSLIWLSVRFNEIGTLDERTWSPIWQQLRTVEFHRCNIICDERLNWTFKLKKGPIHILGECGGPEEWKGKLLIDFFKSRNQ